MTIQKDLENVVAYCEAVKGARASHGPIHLG